jgi:hypothetical protein
MAAAESSPRSASTRAMLAETADRSASGIAAISPDGRERAASR